MTWYISDCLCYLHCFRRVFSACDWAELFSSVERGGGGPGRLTSVWSKFMWNFPRPPGKSLFMNCNKKSHFDGVTLVQEGGGRIWLCLCLRGGGAFIGLGEREGKEEERWESKARYEEVISSPEVEMWGREKNSDGKGRLERRETVNGGGGGITPLCCQQQLLMKHFGSISDSSPTVWSALSPTILLSSEFNAS